MFTVESNRIRNGSAATIWWLLFAVFIAVLPIILFRDFTPSNELRYLSIADESLSTGRWWAFTNHGEPYADKPPLYLWCIMLGKIIFGCHYMWFYALFSIIPAFVIAIVMDRWVGSGLSQGFRVAATLMLFSCGLFAGMVFTLRMDMMMTMFIVLAFYRFRKLELSETPPSLGARLMFGLWVFLAVFSKGPMGILIPLVGTTVWLLLTRRMRLWTRCWGWPVWILLILLCAAWFGAVYSEGGTEYLDNLLVHQTVGRAVNSFHHKRPIWYYLISLTYTLQPWTFVIFGAIVYGIMKFRWKDPGTSTGKFFLTVILSTFVLLSLISSKLQVYMLPAYPFMVYFAIMVCCRHPESGLIALGIMIPTVILAVAGLAAGAALIAVPELPQYAWLPPAIVMLILGTTLTFVWLYVDRRIAWAVSSLSGTVLSLVFWAGLGIDDFNADMGYAAISDEALKVSEHNHLDKPVTIWKLDRPENIDVYLDGYPFRIVESSDSVDVMPVQSLPQVVMTKKEYRNEVPYVKKEYPVGSKYMVLLCDTIRPIRRNLEIPINESEHLWMKVHR